MTHALIVGARGIGKSTLINRVLQELDCSVSGFQTRKEKDLETPQLGTPVYIYDAARPHVQGADNLLGYCRNRRPDGCEAVFDRYAYLVSEAPKQGEVILMDEIGIMESSSEAFCSAILSVLDGEVPVIAAVKFNETPFLDAVRSHPNCKCFWITPENRDALYGEVLPFMRRQLEEAKIRREKKS